MSIDKKRIPNTIKDIITQSVIITAGVGPAGALCPILDIGTVSGTWGLMFCRIAEYHNVEMTSETAVKIITSCGAGIFGYLGGSKVFTFLLNLIPGIGTLGAMGANAMLNGYYTYALGIAFHEMLRTTDINDRTIKEISIILLRLFVPIPSVSDLKEIYHLIHD